LQSLIAENVGVPHSLKHQSIYLLSKGLNSRHFKETAPRKSVLQIMSWEIGVGIKQGLCAVFKFVKSRV
jgi:hypothetical protein